MIGSIHREGYVDEEVGVTSLSQGNKGMIKGPVCETQRHSFSLEMFVEHAWNTKCWKDSFKYLYLILGMQQ